jgi:2-iminobutanoate/2-iminopropanoate deaminase
MGSQRGFNPPNLPAGARPYTMAVRYGNTVYVAGQVGMDFSTQQPVSATDFDAQVHQAMQNLKAVLESAGSSLDKVLSVNCYVTDISLWGRMNEIYLTYFSTDPKPARATVQAGLVPPYMFEIQAIAYVED